MRCADPQQPVPGLRFYATTELFGNSHPVYVTISIPAVGVQLHYTLDGSDPDMNSTVYTGPIAITESTTIKAIAVYPDGSCESAISTATYEFPPDVPVPVFSLPARRD